MLISKIEDIRKHYPISINVDEEDLAPSIKVAQRKYLQPILGKAFEAKATEYYNEGVNDEAHQELLDHIHAPLVCFAILHFIAIRNVIITDDGVRAIHTDNEKPAFAHQVAELKAEVLESAHQNLEVLVEYLEENRDETSLQIWKDDFYASWNKLLVPSGEIFNRYYSLRGNRSVYYLLAPVLDRLEQLIIIPVTGQELYDQLKEDVKNEVAQSSGYTAETPATVMPLVRLALCYGALHHGFAEHILNVTLTGWSQFPDYRATQQKDLEPIEKKLNQIREQTLKEQNQYLKMLKNELQRLADADQLDVYKNSDAYTPPPTEDTTEEDLPGFFLTAR